MGLVEPDGESGAQRVSVRANVGTSGDPAHRLPDHLRRPISSPDARRAPVRDHVLVRANSDFAGLPCRAKDRDELVGRPRHRRWSRRRAPPLEDAAAGGFAPSDSSRCTSRLGGLEEALEARDVESESRWRGVVPARQEPAALGCGHFRRVLPSAHSVGELEQNPLVRPACFPRPLPQGELAHEEVDGLADVADFRHA